MQCMVTGRMDETKKKRAARILKREGLNASAAINMMYDRLIEDGNADFMRKEPRKITPEEWKRAAEFIDSIPIGGLSPEFDDMTRGEIKLARAKKRGIIE